MTVHGDDPALESKRLQRALSDIMALLALPAAWSARTPADTLTTTLDVLVATMHLDFACGRLHAHAGGAPHEAARLPLGRAAEDRSHAVRAALSAWLSVGAAEIPTIVANPAGAGDVALLRAGLGLRDDLGVVIVGASRADFPTALDRLLLGIATNQAAIGIQDARHLDEQRRLRQLETQERELQARFDATLDERTRIAREMHDTLLQGFTGVTLHLAALSRDPSVPSGVRSGLRRVMDLAQRTLADGRQAVWGLRTSPFAGRALADELRRLAVELLGPTGIRFTIEVTGPPRPLRQSAELAVVRIAREALANVVAHSAARTVAVRVAYEPDGLVLSIGDDGIGFAVHADLRAFGGHWGLIGMRERAVEAAGMLQVRSAPGAGVEIGLRLPYGPGE